MRVITRGDSADDSGSNQSSQSVEAQVKWPGRQPAGPDAAAAGWMAYLSACISRLWN